MIERGGFGVREIIVGKSERTFLILVPEKIKFVKRVKRGGSGIGDT